MTVEYMTGFRMSFRRDVIRSIGFEEAFKGYGLYEGIEASFAATALRALVDTRDAQIYYHRFPSGRPDRYAFAAMAVLNRAFVIARHSRRLPAADRETVRAKARNYVLARMAMLLPKLNRPNARANFRGTKTGLGAMEALFSAAPDDLVKTYEDARLRTGIHA